jgi:uncharacterized protein (UPF0335 family)
MLNNLTITQCSRALEIPSRGSENDTVAQGLEAEMRSFVARKTRIDQEMSAIFQQVSQLAAKASDLATELEDQASKVMTTIQSLRGCKVGYEGQSAVAALSIFEKEVTNS